jgi:hypothetical protein
LNNQNEANYENKVNSDTSLGSLLPESFLFSTATFLFPAAVFAISTVAWTAEDGACFAVAPDNNADTTLGAFHLQLYMSSMKFSLS